MRSCAVAVSAGDCSTTFTVAAADFEHLVQHATVLGWALLFPDRHPWAGGAGHRAAYLADVDGFEVELVADPG